MTKNKLSKIIDKYQSRITDEVRDYIGASIIGSDCLRQIWYEFKGEKSEGVASKTRRTWNIGKKLERLVIAWMKESGCNIEIHDYTWHAKNVPIFKGHVDALINIDNKLSILEIKTAKDASFKVFVNKGLQIWNKQYYSQVQAYMGMSDINSAYILVLNKDNSDISDEFVTFDEQYYRELENRAVMISTAKHAPPRISNSPIWYKCKMCKFNKVCHE